MKIIQLLLLSFSLIGFTSANTRFPAEPLVRVRVINSLDSLHMHFNDPWYLSVMDSVLYAFPPGSELLATKTSTGILLQSTVLPGDTTLPAFMLAAGEPEGTLKIAQVPYGVGWWWGGREDRIYEGGIHIYRDHLADLCVTVHLPLERYLKGVVPYEIGGESPREALRAQAVSARSEAVVALESGLYGGEHHDLTSDVECQVFSGNQRRTEMSDQAVDDTRGLILTEAGQPIHAFYASNCGGYSEAIQYVWPDRHAAASYGQGRPDGAVRRPKNLSSTWRMRRWLGSSPKVWCNPELESALPDWSQKNFRWSREFSSEALSKMIASDPAQGRLKRIRILERGQSGRIYKAELVFQHGRELVTGELALRQRFSPSLRSSAFIVKRRWGKFILEGAGWGHGVGMCQSGAIAQASHGRSFLEILKHYYPEADVETCYAARVNP